ncbi:LysE family transporter [Pseudomonas fluorescens]|uniref:LysE family translocator n=1 Tax=Pseudomonas fluorescens TaxID=294 RepID=UPI0017819A5E|nr:LysE family transporter [Pseudomonas fluorescens]MBD8147434.1 LysE family transporter [Pseudomonas fluorescens]MBD8175906.1 LysE family transporter [Pseudomonas fluorescens]MBD8744361.1 LysE family transporter [Pseudomonas fluorescens]MBD8753300.1 LysE family transporter [Pseudomonas fluorescens]MBD8759163.1 LysE family transporter [Pseudomonas fluorescens]
MELFNPAYVAPLVSLALLWTVAVVTPGPNFFNTAQLAASCSRRHGVVASAGVATGTILWGLAGGLGIKSLFTAAPMLYLAFKIIGGCYLIYLGLKLFKRSATSMGQTPLPDAARRSLFSAWRLGLLGNLSNPKAALFVATIFASTMPPSPSPVLLTLAVIVMATLSFSWYTSVALLFSSERMATFYSRSRKWLDRFAGGCYVLFGSHLIANR